MEYNTSTLEIANRNRAVSKKLFEQWFNLPFSNHPNINYKQKNVSFVNNNEYSRQSPELRETVCSFSFRKDHSSKLFNHFETSYSPFTRCHSQYSLREESLPLPPPPLSVTTTLKPPVIMLHRSPSGAQKKIRQKREEKNQQQILNQNQQSNDCSSMPAGSLNNLNYADDLSKSSSTTTNLPSTANVDFHSYLNVTPSVSKASFSSNQSNAWSIVNNNKARSSFGEQTASDYRSMVDLHGYRSILPEHNESNLQDNEVIQSSSLSVSYLPNNDVSENVNNDDKIDPYEWKPYSLRLMDSSKKSFRESQNDEFRKQARNSMYERQQQPYNTVDDAWQNTILYSSGSVSRLNLESTKDSDDPHSPKDNGNSVTEISTKIGELHNMVGALVGNVPANRSSNCNGVNHFGKPTVEVHPMPAKRTVITNSPPETLKKLAPPPVPKKPNQYKINVIPRAISPDTSSSQSPSPNEHSSSPTLSKTPSWKRLPNTVSKYRNVSEKTSRTNMDEMHSRTNSVSTINNSSNWSVNKENNDQLIANKGNITIIDSNNTIRTTTFAAPYTLESKAKGNENKNIINGIDRFVGNKYYDFNNNFDENSITARDLSSTSLSSSTIAHSYSSSLDGPTTTVGNFNCFNKNINNEIAIEKKVDSSSFSSISNYSADNDHSRKLNTNSQSLLNLHNCLNHAIFNPEEHSYEELIALEKRRRECIDSLTLKIADRETDLATIDEDFENVKQSREEIFHKISTYGDKNPVLLTRITLHKCEGGRLAELEARLDAQFKRLEKSCSPNDERRRQYLEEQREDAQMIRTAFDAREKALEDELYKLFDSNGDEQLVADWRFCNQAVVRLNAERKIVLEALSVIKQQLSALQSINVLQRAEIEGSTPNVIEFTKQTK